MPLDSAVADIPRNKIYGCRGPFAYRFNGTTGALEMVLKCGRHPWKSSICYDDILDKVYWVGQFDDAQQTWHYPFLLPDQFVPQIIDPVTFLSAGAFHSQSNTTIWEPGSFIKDIWKFSGVDQVFYSLAISQQFGQDFGNMQLLPPFTGGTFNYVAPGGAYDDMNFGNMMGDLCYDSTNNWVWACDKLYFNVWNNIEDFTVPGYWDAANNYYYVDNVPLPVGLSTTPNMLGITHCPDNNRLYLATGTRWVLKLVPTIVSDPTNPSGTWIDLGRSGAHPYRIKYRASDKKIYVPCLDDDTVCVIDPLAADAVTVKTGFDFPIDIVPGLAKCWAVQHGVVPLKEVI